MAWLEESGYSWRAQMAAVRSGMWPGASGKLMDGRGDVFMPSSSKRPVATALLESTGLRPISWSSEVSELSVFCFLQCRPVVTEAKLRWRRGVQWMNEVNSLGPGEVT